MTRPVPAPDAEVLELSGDSRHLLGDGACLWRVERGHLDLFWVELDDQGLPGRRHYALRLAAGEAAFGVPRAPDATCDLLLVGEPGTQVRRVPLDRLGRAGGGQPPSPELLDGWLDALGHAADPEAPPEETLLARAPSELDLPAGRPLRARRETVLWVQVADGSVSPAGVDASAALSPDPAFLTPLTAWSAVVSEEGARVRLASTRAALGHPGWWPGLQAFTARTLERLSATARRRAEGEALQRRERRGVDVERFSVALYSLAEVGEAADGEQPLGTSDALLATCRRIGAALGVAVHAPAHTDAAREPVEAIARASGLRVRRVLLRGRWWRRDMDPLLAVTEEGEVPVALLRRGGRTLLLSPDGSERGKRVTPKVAAGLRSEAWAFYAPFPDRPLGALDLLRFSLRACRADVARILLLGLAAAVVAWVVPVATGLLFDHVIPGAHVDQLVQLGLALLVVALANACFMAVRGFAVVRLEVRMNTGTQAALWDRLLGLSPSWFARWTTGDLQDRASGIDAIRRTLSGTLLGGMLGSIVSLSNLFVLFYYDVGLALLGTGVVFVALLVALGTGVVALRYQTRIAALRGRLASRLLDLLSGISKLRVAGAEPRAFSAWAEAFSPLRRTVVAARRFDIDVDLFLSAYPVLCTLAVFSAAAPAVGSGLSTGSFLAFFSAFGAFLAGTMQLVDLSVELLGVVPLYRRARPILETRPETSADRPSPGRLRGEIDISHATFRYVEGGPPVLEDVTLRVKPGEFVAVVGPSGSGKSTLLRLLLGFETPESGAVYFDGQDLSAVDVEAVRRQIGVVLQTSQVLAGDLFSNITGSLRLTQDDAWQAAKMAALADEIEAMPMGMYTVCDQQGSNLSGGQRQRLLLARAVASRPRILVLDEATSALDNAGQRQVSESLEGLHVTRVVVAHRLSTIRHADRIVVMRGGRVVQEGRFEELVEAPGLFAELARRQLL